MASFLIQNKSRFVFSHETVWCPLKQFILIINGEDMNAVIHCNDIYILLYMKGAENEKNRKKCIGQFSATRPLSVTPRCTYVRSSTHE